MNAEAALVRALAQAWSALNGSHFRGGLRPPAFTLTEGKRLGAWQPATRTLSIGRRFALEQPWPAVVEVLKHEMAHQYVHEVLGITDETADAEGALP